MNRKAELRKKYLALRDGMSRAERAEKSSEILKNLLSLPAFEAADTVLVYVSVGSEPETRGIIETALSLGKTVAVPYTENGNMTFRKITSAGGLIKGEFGIPTGSGEEVEPGGSCLCLTPALTVDSRMNRLGYGGGYYDRYLSSRPGITAAALCFEKTLSESIPAFEHDIKMDFVITEKRLTGGAEYAG